MSQNPAIEPTELIWGKLVPPFEMQSELFEEPGLKEIIHGPIGGIFTMLVTEKI